MKNLLLFLFCLWSTCAFATAYYADPDCANNGDGTAQACGAAGGAGAYNCSATITLTGESNDLFFKRGTTCNTSVVINADGTALDSVEIGPYGVGADPILTNYKTVTTWSLYGGNIYYSTGYTDYSVYVLTVDGTRMRGVLWDTDIATTAADMTAGSYTFSETDNSIYLWTSDSADPTAKTVLRSYNPSTTVDNGYCLNAYSFALSEARDYLYIHDLDIKLCNMNNLLMSRYGTADVSNYSIIENLDFDLCGQSCAVIGGTNFEVNGTINCTDSNSEMVTIKPCVEIVGGNASDEGATGMDITGISCTNTRNGSCFEINHGVSFSTIHHNTGTNYVVHLFEIWNNSNHNSIYDNKGMNVSYADCTDAAVNSTRYPEGKCKGQYGGGIAIHASSDGNIVYNNILNGGRAHGIGIGCNSTSCCGCDDNVVANNTFMNFGYTGGTNYVGIDMARKCASQTGNLIYNNIVYNPNQGYGIRFPSGFSATNISDYNDIYAATFGLITTDGGSNTTKTFTEWKALSLDSNSTDQDPLIDSTLYNLSSSSSPAVNSGLNLNGYFVDDYDGYTRAGFWDIGAYEFRQGGTPGNRVTLKRITIK